MNLQQTWQGGVNSMYSSRQGFNIPPPPPGQLHQPYNPKLHAQMSTTGQTVSIPQMSATYVPTGDTYGDVPGLPGFGPEESATAPSTHASWRPATATQAGSDSNTTTPMDDHPASLQPGNAQGRGVAADPVSGSYASSIPPEIAAQWSPETVLVWLSKQQFSKEWQETFRVLGLHGAQFLELGTSRGSYGMMHQHVYPQLRRQCTENATDWDEVKERGEGRRLRKLIRSIVSRKPPDSSKRDAYSSSQGGTNLPSAGTDPSESPNVSTSPMPPVCQGDTTLCY